MQTADTLAHIADEGRVRRAKRFGEKSNFFDPEVSEWENPIIVTDDYIVPKSLIYQCNKDYEGTARTETSK